MNSNTTLEINPSTIWSASSRIVYDHIGSAGRALHRLHLEGIHERAQSRLVNCIGSLGNARAEAMRLGQHDWCRQLDAVVNTIRQLLQDNTVIDEHAVLVIEGPLSRLADEIWSAR